MGQSQSVPSISNGSPSDSKKRSSTSSNSALSGLDGLEPTLPIALQVLIQGNALVEHLAIYKGPLKQDQKALSHHFLIIRVAHIQEMTTVRYVKAEKHVDAGRGTISISVGDEEFDPADIPEKHGLAMEGCGMITVQKLTDILRAPSPRYSLLTHNCWKYADEAFRLLIEEFSELPETTSEAKQRLQSYLAELRPLELPGHAFNFHWAWVRIAAAALLTGASVYGYYAIAATSAGSLRTLLVQGLGHAFPGLRTFAKRYKDARKVWDVARRSESTEKFGTELFKVLANAASVWDGHKNLSVDAVPHWLWPTLIIILKQGQSVKKEIGIRGGMLLALCPEVLLIATGAIVGVAIVLGLSWGLYKISRGIAGNLRGSEFPVDVFGLQKTNLTCI
ncbi:unnamed protein product [Calypogeia fissa]